MALTQISTQGIKDGTITGSDLTTSFATTGDFNFTGDNANIFFDKSNDNIRVFDNASIDFGQSGDLKIHHTGNVNIIDDVQSKNISIQRAGSEQWKFGDGTFLGPDNKKIQLGNSQDLQIYHDGTNDRIDSSGSFLILEASNHIFRNTAGNEDYAKFLGNGAVELYHDNSKKFETHSAGVLVSGNAYLNDNNKFIAGTHNDLQIYHDGSNSYIDDTGTGDLNISGSIVRLQDSNRLTYCRGVEGGAFEIYHNNSLKFETASHGATLTGNLRLPDNTSGNASIQLGNSQDFFMNHNGTDSFIINNTGDLYIRDLNGDVHIQGKDNEESIIAKADGAVELYHNNSKKFETYAGGAQWSGAIRNPTDGIDQGIYFGVDSDFQLSHDGSNNHIKGIGNHFIRFWTANVNRWNIANDGHFRPETDNSLDIGASNQRVRSIFASNALDMADNAKVQLGNSDDLQIYHDGSESYVKNTNAGSNLILESAHGVDIKHGGENMAKFKPDGAVELYHDNVKMLDTSSQGVNFRGEIRSASTDSNLSNCTLKNESTNADGTDYFQCRTDNNTLRLVIEPDGDVKNQNQSYGQISDSKHKENIVDANSQWNDIKAIKVRNFNFKESTGFSTHTQIGVVAQELETSSPNLVYESIDRDPVTGEDLETKTKNVRYSVMYMKAIKCLQEAIAKIEVLETEVAALKAG